MTPTIRDIILARLKEMGHTPYWLSVTQRAVSQQTVQMYLSGKRGAQVKTIEELLRVTGLKVVPNEK